MGIWGPFIFFALLRNQYTQLSFAATLEHNNNNIFTGGSIDEPSARKWNGNLCPIYLEYA